MDSNGMKVANSILSLLGITGMQGGTMKQYRSRDLRFVVSGWQQKRKRERERERERESARETRTAACMGLNPVGMR